MTDHLRNRILDMLENLLEELNHQPNWGIMGLANSAVAGYVATNGQTKKMQKLFADTNEALQKWVDEHPCDHDEISAVMQAFLDGKVLQNYMWQKYGKVKKAIKELIDEMKAY